MVADKQRCLIITHPSFQGGVEAIREAREFGDLMKSVINGDGMFEGVPPNQRDQLKQHLKQFKLLIRKLPKDLL